MITELSSIFGPATASAEQVARNILRRPHGEYTDHDIEAVIVPTYFLYCENLGLNPVIVLAQVEHESANLSSWWAARPRRNPAGIGVTGRQATDPPADRNAWAWKKESKIWLMGVSFDSWQDDAIPAHPRPSGGHDHDDRLRADDRRDR